mgnify:CR=1 FL=1
MARKAAIIGGGVIGGGWAARFLLSGWDVAIFDPDPEAGRKVSEVLANARAALPALSDVPVPAGGRLTFASDIAGAVAGHPELRGKAAMFITHLNATDLSTVNFYTTNDTRVSFFADLGLTSPKSVIEASAPGKFSGSISAERIDAFDDVDIVVTYGNRQLLDALAANPLTARMPAVASGALVILGRDPAGTAANPTPLSISWVLKDYVNLLAEAARKSR